jgi:Helix-turn-helix
MSRRRAPWAGCACHMPLPRLPRRLRSIEVAWGKKWDLDRPYEEAEPLTAADLTTDARGRLLARAETRYRRLHAGARHARTDWYWLEAELRLVLPRAHPKVVKRWREAVRWGIFHAEWALDRLRRLEAAVLEHEPETDAWLRAQLGTLADVAVGSRTIMARHRHRWSRADLAARARVGVMTLARLERGEGCPRPLTLQRLAAACGVTVDWLLTGRTEEAETSGDRPGGRW